MSFGLRERVPGRSFARRVDLAMPGLRDGNDGELHEVSGEPGESFDRLAAFRRSQGIQIVYNAKIAPAMGISYGGRIAILPGQSNAEELSTLVHEAAHLCCVRGYVA